MTQQQNNWHKSSWRDFPIKQQPNYPDQSQLKNVESELSKLPSLVTAQEIMALRADLAQVAQGKAFLLQGGDCAESFAEFSQENLQRYFRVMLQMTVALMYGAACPVVKVGRIAGQFAKPRSADQEEKDGKSLPSYRGDMVNSMDFDDEQRIPDPKRLIDSYYQSASTLNYIRSLARGGYSSLRNITRWNSEFIKNSPQGKLFEDMVLRIGECLDFIDACKLPAENIAQLHEAEFYSSHEGLLLNYEEAFVEYDKGYQQHFARSAHMLWIGDRTRSLDEAHVEFMRGVANPVGVKAGPSISTDDLLRLIETINPDNIPGKIVLITRMGASKVDELLPPLVRKVVESGYNVVWSSDPMHGNIIKSPSGHKTRHFNDILSELKSFFAICNSEGAYPGGVHFEMTGQDVTECLGGAQAISELDLHHRYHTHCDPRLNGSQSLELAFLIAKLLKDKVKN